MTEIGSFPKELVGEKDLHGNKLVYVEGLEDDLILCFKDNVLPNELELGWSERGKKITLKNYAVYPSV